MSNKEELDKARCPYIEIFENNLRAINDSKPINDLIMVWFKQSVDEIVKTNCADLEVDLLQTVKWLHEAEKKVEELKRSNAMLEDIFIEIEDELSDHISHETLDKVKKVNQNRIDEL